MSGKVFLAVGLDAGASRTRCLVCVIESLRMRCLGYGECPSEGWVKSRIRDQNALTQSVLEALHEAEHRAQVSIESAVVGFGGLTVRGANSRSRIELGRPRAIEQRDVNRALDRASRVQLHEDRMVLQLFAQDFIVEDQAGQAPLDSLAFLFVATRSGMPAARQAECYRLRTPTGSAVNAVRSV